MSNKNYYEVMGVSPSATDTQIRDAYRALVRQYHPDNYQGHPLQSVAQEKMQEINEAYAVLSDAEKRREYDSQYVYRQTGFGGFNQQGQPGQQGQNPFTNGFRPPNWGYQQNYGPYYQRGGGGGCGDTLCTLCVLDQCCECMGGDLCSCC